MNCKSTTAPTTIPQIEATVETNLPKTKYFQSIVHRCAEFNFRIDDIAYIGKNRITGSGRWITSCITVYID
jgi:hypothetical protein